MRKPANPFAVTYALLRSHTRLFYHELQHEKELAWRRLRVIGVGVVFFVAAIAFLELAIYGSFRSAGLSQLVASMLMVVLNSGAGAVFVFLWGRRPFEDGKAFEMSRAEYQRTKKWIENRFVKNDERSAANSN